MKCNILIADDEVGIASSVEIILLSEGHSVTLVSNGRDALEEVKKRDSSNQFNILITDVQMPLMSGTDLIREVVATYTEIGIIAITGYGDRETVISLMKAGCRDFLDKPFTDEEIVSAVNRLSIEAEKRKERFLRIVSEKNKEINRLYKTFKELEAQFKDASVSYDELVTLNKEIIPLHIHERIKPLTAVGGDLLAIEERQDGTLAILVADVAGHDISASYHALLIKTLFSTFCKDIQEPSQFFYNVNDLLLLSKNDRMITAVIAVVDNKNQTLTISTAGHPPIIISDTEEARLIECDGDVIGLLDSAVYSNQTIRVQKDSRLFFYTDGMAELQYIDGATGRRLLLSPEGLKQLVSTYKNLTLSEQVDAVWDDALDFARYRIKDDLLLLGVVL